MFRRKKKTERVILPPVIKTDKSLVVDLNNGRYLKVGSAQNQGKRPYQEDNYGYSNLTDPNLIASKGVLAVLADGMGGLAHGKEVSAIAVSEMLNYFNNPNTVCTDGNQMFAHAKQINDTVCNRYCEDGRINAGSTLVCALVNNGVLHWVCVGDSRLYLRRNGQMYQVNEDHDYLNELLTEAVFEEEEVSAAFTDSKKDMLVSCIGNRDLRGDVSRDGVPLLPGDWLLLCSDGVYNALPLDAINILMDGDAQLAAESIEAAVLSQNFQTQDNFTIVILNYN